MSQASHVEQHDVAEASPALTMPSRYYTDPDVYELDKERIFYRTWQFAGHVNDLPEPGCFRTVRIADESLVVVRGRDGVIRAYYNVCRHRAHRLVDGGGRCRTFVCPYHAWTYDLEGRLVAAPGTDEIRGIDKAAIRLSEVHLEVFCGLLFVNLDDHAVPLTDLYPGLQEEILAAKPGLSGMVRVFEDRIAHHCNWKVSVENFSECYHCPVVHRYVVSNIYSADDYRITISGGIVRHFSPRLSDREAHGDLHIWHLWPNLAIELFPLHRAISIRHFEAEGPRATTYTYLWYADPDLPKAAIEAVVETGRIYRETYGAENARLVMNVQKGLESRAYDRGPLVLTPAITAESEHAVAHFQSRYLDAIGS